MKVGILAGGKGTRLAEETQVRPKPLVEIGDRPILWHIMQIYSHYGYQDFVIGLGYRGDMIKRPAREAHPGVDVGRGFGPLEALGLREEAMRVALTGHRGYVGTVLAPMLVEVVGFDTDLYRGSTFERGVIRGAGAAGVTFLDSVAAADVIDCPSFPYDIHDEHGRSA